DCNSGDCNSGDCNSGNRNSGNRNSGNRNSGDRNSGNRNSGNWNSGDCNSGYFNSDEPNVRMFNKDTNLKREEINIPNWCYFDLTVWVSHDTATEEEKETHKKEIETCGGFLKTLEYKEAWRLAWGKAIKEEHKQLLKLPNWDNEVFKEITGINAEAEIAKE
ncbi:MAG: pentapeptide repeat-containing protein, partial [Methanobrevibacter sp.]|nr:pentapeptide repeat-containing protein [Methanobrevibacter sp.]